MQRSDTDYARWIVEAWERLLLKHFRSFENLQNASVGGFFRFDNLPAMMRVRVTTPNVLKALGERDPGAAKPYNFAHSPILLEDVPECTLIAPANKRSREWLTRDYTGIHTGEVVKLGSKYRDKTLTPQTISHTIWKHFLHPEDTSLGPYAVSRIHAGTPTSSPSGSHAAVQLHRQRNRTEGARRGKPCDS